MTENNGKTKRQVHRDVYTLRRNDAGDWKKIEKFFHDHDHKYVDIRHTAAYEEATRRGCVYTMENPYDEICASVIGWDLGKDFVEIGSARSIGPNGYNFAQILAACVMANYFIEEGDQYSLSKGQTKVLSIVYGESYGAKILRKLGFNETTLSKDFMDARDQTIVNDNNLSHTGFEFPHDRFSSIVNFIESIRNNSHLYDNDSKSDPIFLDVSKLNRSQGQGKPFGYYQPIPVAISKLQAA